MNSTPNWKELKLNNQCGICIYYKPWTINEKLAARGTCTFTDVYKQRTETCRKFKEEQ